MSNRVRTRNAALVCVVRGRWAAFSSLCALARRLNAAIWVTFANSVHFGLLSLQDDVAELRRINMSIMFNFFQLTERLLTKPKALRAKIDELQVSCGGEVVEIPENNPTCFLNRFAVVVCQCTSSIESLS